MTDLLPIHQELQQKIGNEHVAGIVNFQWLTDSLKEEMFAIERFYRTNYIDTNFPEISIRFSFDAGIINIIPSGQGDNSFIIENFNFEFHLIEKNGGRYGDPYGTIFIENPSTVKGTFEIDETTFDITYNLTPVDLTSINITTSNFDNTVILRNFSSIQDFEASVRAIKLFLDYNYYVEDLFSSLPTPDVFSSLGSYSLQAPYQVEVSTLGLDDYLVVKAGILTNQTEFCDCGTPGGVRTEDIIIERGEEGDSTEVRRRVIQDSTPINGNLNGRFVAGFLFPYHDPKSGNYKTFMEHLTSEIFLTTTVKDKGKKNGVKYDYRITASIPLSSVRFQTIHDPQDNSYKIEISLPMQISGKVNFKKEIGCGVSIKDSVQLTQGRIDPYNISIEVRFINTTRGREVLLIPSTEAKIHFRLRPKGIFAFLGILLGPKIDRKIIQQQIVEKTNKQIINLIKAYSIPTIPQKNIRVGSTMFNDTLFVGLGDQNNEG